MDSKNKGIFRILSLVIVLTMLALTLSSCTGSGETKSVRASSVNITEADYSARANHVSSEGNLIYVTKSGLLELYFDSVTYSVAIKDTSTEKFWYSLPKADITDSECHASVLSLSVSRGNETYYLNSQDNSVAFSTASFKPINNGVSITYDLAPDSETANKSYESLSDKDVYVSVTAVFTLTDGAFYAKINCSNILTSKGCTVENIDFMTYFGSAEGAGENDFLFVPDNCGALVKTGVADSEFSEERNYDIYGENLALGENDSADALFPCFGIKSGDNAFAAIILGGECLASVRAQRRNGAGTFNRVSARFKITDTCSDPDGSGRKYTGLTYAGDINICYRFLSGKNADYLGIASACREVLIRQSVLSTELLSPSEHIPLVVSVQGAATKRFTHSYKKLSTYEQTLELLEGLKAKSINSITLRYCGMLDGADTQDAISDASVLKKLGGKKDFEALSQYAKTQKFNMYLDIAVLSSNKKNSTDAAKTAYGSKTPYNVAGNYGLFGRKPAMNALSVSDISDNLVSFLMNSKNFDFDGYCINDAGKVLYSDYSGDTYTRSGAASAIRTQTAVLSNNHKIIISKGNFYMLFNADAVIDLPRDTYYPETDGYVPIPFAEIVLHGILNYTLEPINLQSDTKAALLRSLEYGALPSFEWVCTKVGDEEFDNKFYYQDQLATAAEYYTLADEVLGDLADARITAHYKVQSGVYCTEFNNSTILYINYNETPVTVNSITVPAQSCIRAN